MDAATKKKVQKVLKKVMQHEIAESFFNEPVDPDALGIPEYREIIRNPMDLGTIARRLESGFYASAAAVAQDVCLVWRNCHIFNEPGSDVYKSCDEIAGFFDQLWKQAKLEKAPGPSSPGGSEGAAGLTHPGAWLPDAQADGGGGRSGANGLAGKGRKVATINRAGDLNVLGGGPSGQPGGRPGLGGLDYGLPQLDAPALRQGHPLQRCLNVLNYVMQHPAAAPFCSQDAGFLAYYHLTGEQPVDLTTIRERLMPGTTQGWGTIYYKSTTDVLQDVRRVWNGYRSSYDPCDPVVAACDVVERAFNYAWTQAGLSLDVPSSQGPPDQRTQQRRLQMQMQQRRVQQYSSEEDASPRAAAAATRKPAAPTPSPVIRQRSDGKPERQAAKRFKSAVQLHGDSESDEATPEPSESSDSEVHKWRPQSTPGRCDVCKRAKKGRCGTETAPARCERRPENSTKNNLSARNNHSGSAKPSLKRKNSWEVDGVKGYPHQQQQPPPQMVARASAAAQRLSAVMEQQQQQQQQQKGSSRLDYVQNEQEKRVLMEWAQLLRARQEAAKAIELANKAVAQVAAAEAALRGAVAYEEAVAANEAAKPRSEPWPPDARLAPPGYTPPNPMAQPSRPQGLPPDIMSTGNFWFGQVPGSDQAQDRNRPAMPPGTSAMASAAMSLQQRLAQFQQAQRQQQQPGGQQQQPQPISVTMPPPLTLPQSSSQPFPPYMYRQQQPQQQEQQQQAMQGAGPSSSQPAASREPGSAQATPSYGSGLTGPQMAGSPRVGKPEGHPPWSDPTMGPPGQPGSVPASAGALQQPLPAFSGFDGGLRLQSGVPTSQPTPSQPLAGQGANTAPVGMMDLNKSLHQTVVPQFGANIFDY
ncbi:g3031 [Coccomyxa elongata]